MSLSFTDTKQQASENAWGIHRYQWQHINAQNIIEKRFDLKGAQTTFSWGDFEIRNQYDKFGNQTQSQVLNEQGQQERRFTVNYSKNGLRREWLKSYNAENELAASPMLGGAAALKFEYQGKSLTPSKRIPYGDQLKKTTQQ